MTMKFATSLRNSRANQIAAAIDADAAPGVLTLFTGPRPATGAAITTQTLLATLTFAQPCAPAAANGVLTFDDIAADPSADATGTPTWGRIRDGDNVFVLDLSVGGPGSGADIELTTADIVSGETVEINSAIIREGNGDLEA